MKYRYTVIHEGTVDGENERDAEAAALVMCDGGFAEATAVQVEQIREDAKGDG